MSIPLNYIELGSDLLPLGSGLIAFKRLGTAMRLFFIFVTVNTLSDAITLVMAKSNIRNLWVLHIDHLLEYVLLALVLRSWQGRPWIRRALWWSTIVFAALWVVAQFTVEPMRDPDYYSHTLECLILIMVIVVTIFDLTSKSPPPIIRDGRLWISAGLLIYFAGDFLLYLFWNEIVALGRTKAAEYWKINWYLNMLVNGLYAVGFWIEGR